ncbi:hypothetical protein ACROYT_G002134 [Oculina patagonica]
MKVPTAGLLVKEQKSLTKHQTDPVEENTIYTTNAEKVLSLNAKTAPNQDERDPSTKDQEFIQYQAYQNKHEHQLAKQQGILASSSVSQDLRQDIETLVLNQVKIGHKFFQAPQEIKRHKLCH